MELPECPVCLQTYDGDETVPRVLGCGHSLCEACLTHLPRRFPQTIRCPACTQLVSYPHPQGPSALPKNIDLLRLSLSHKPSLNPDPKRPISSPKFDFLPPSWSDEFYSAWKDWVLPNNAVSAVQPQADEQGIQRFPSELLLHGKVVSRSSSSSLRSRFRCKENQTVSLVRVSSSLRVNDSVFAPGYVVRITECLSKMRDGERAELDLILRACSRQPRVCNCYGLWYNSEDSCVYLVCERCCLGFVEKLGELGSWHGLTEKMDLVFGDGILGFALVGLEICEALINLHSEGLVAGCVGFSCFHFDDLGHVYVNLNEILVTGRKICRCIVEGVSGRRRVDKSEMGIIWGKILKTHVFVSPEVLFELLQKAGVALEFGGLRYSVGYGSDAWSLACILLSLFIGKPFTEELANYMQSIFQSRNKENDADHLGSYLGWMEKVTSLLEAKIGSKYACFQQILCNCLNSDPKSRPLVTDVWKCIRELIIKPQYDIFVSLDGAVKENNAGCCMVLGELCKFQEKTIKGLETQKVDDLEGEEHNGVAKVDQVGELSVDRDLFEGVSAGNFKVVDLRGHLDCITSLAVGGGFLFSSSFDKTIHVWSLQDFTLVHSFRGHEHRVMAVVFVDEEQPFCISGDIGGGIFMWGVSSPFGQEPIKKWYEQKDWRYSGIHALAVSCAGYLYTGSGDKSIKAWSLQDYTLSCAMNGHKSVVSTLAVYEGILYSGSWDGTVRLWSLNDHSPLTVLGEEASGNVASVRSLTANRHVLVVAYENGNIKIWRNDVFMRSTQLHTGAIFAVGMEGKWLFTGGWDEILDVQELSGDEFHIDAIPVGSISCESVITALLYWQGNLFVGFADRLIKAHYCGE